MSSIPDPATTEWVPLQGRASGMSYRGQYVGGQTYNDGDCAIGPDGVLYCCIKDGTTTTPDVWPGAAGPAGPAGVGSDLRYDGSWVAGSYTDGDIVIGADGITYICVRPTSAAPIPWASAILGKPSYGTTLPAAPYDGQEAVLVDSVTAPTYQWQFRYNANNTTAYKWEFVGGAPFALNETTPVSLASTFSATGPVFAIPRAGIYFVDFQGSAYCATMPSYVSFGIVGPYPPGSALLSAQYDDRFAAASEAELFSFRAPMTINPMTISGGQKWTENSITSVNRSLVVTPVRIS